MHCNVCGEKEHKGKCKGIRSSNLLLPWNEWSVFARSIISKVEKDIEYWIRYILIMDSSSDDEKRKQRRLGNYIGFFNGIKYANKE